MRMPYMTAMKPRQIHDATTRASIAGLQP